MLFIFFEIVNFLTASQLFTHPLLFNFFWPHRTRTQTDRPSYTQDAACFPRLKVTQHKAHKCETKCESPPNESIFHFQFTRYLFSTNGSRIDVFSVASGELVYRLAYNEKSKSSAKCHQNESLIKSICVNTSNKYQLLSFHLGGRICLWDYEDGLLLKVTNKTNHALSTNHFLLSVRFNPDFRHKPADQKGAADRDEPLRAWQATVSRVRPARPVQARHRRDCQESVARGASACRLQLEHERREAACSHWQRVKVHRLRRGSQVPGDKSV